MFLFVLGIIALLVGIVMALVIRRECTPMGVAALIAAIILLGMSTISTVLRV